MEQKPCKRGNVAERDKTGHCLCPDCKAFRNRPTPRRRAYLKKWQRQNKHKTKEYYQRWCQKHPEQRRAIERAWRLANPEKARAMSNKAGAKWSKNNPGKRNAITRRREAAKLSRTVSWSNKDKITAIYEEAARLTKETGIPHEVDHIIPLQGETVSGLHVENNLQIVLRSVNRAKKNRCVAS